MSLPISLQFTMTASNDLQKSLEYNKIGIIFPQFHYYKNLLVPYTPTLKVGIYFYSKDHTVEITETNIYVQLTQSYSDANVIFLIFPYQEENLW